MCFSTKLRLVLKEHFLQKQHCLRTTRARTMKEELSSANERFPMDSGSSQVSFSTVTRARPIWSRDLMSFSARVSQTSASQDASLPSHSIDSTNSRMLIMTQNNRRRVMLVQTFAAGKAKTEPSRVSCNNEQTRWRTPKCSTRKPSMQQSGCEQNP